MELLQVLPLRISVDLGVLTMKGYSIFPKGPGEEAHDQMQFRVISGTLIERVIIPFCRDAVDVFNSSSRLDSPWERELSGNIKAVIILIIIEETSINKIYLNTEKNGGLRRLAVTYSPVKSASHKWCDYSCQRITEWKPKKTKRETSGYTLQRTRKSYGTWKWQGIPTVIGAHGTILNDLVKGLKGLEIGWRIDTVQTMALLRSRIVLEI